jgi:hypothetical protein
MDRETLADKVIHLVETITNRALEVPEDLRSAFIDRAIAELKAAGNYPDDGFVERIEGYIRTRLDQIQASGGASMSSTAGSTMIRP